MFGIYEEEPVFLAPFAFLGAAKDLINIRPGGFLPIKNGGQVRMLKEPPVNYDCVAGLVSEDV